MSGTLDHLHLMCGETFFLKHEAGQDAFAVKILYYKVVAEIQGQKSKHVVKRQQWLLYQQPEYQRQGNHQKRQ